MRCSTTAPGCLSHPATAGLWLRPSEQLLHDRELRRQMGMTAREWVAERFVHTRVQSLTVGLYRQLMVEAGREPVAAMTTDAAAAGD